MKGDFTRDTFNPSKHYSRVMLQQGRVQLDADWNEQSAIVLHYLRALSRDIIGAHGGPADGSGFEIVTDPTKIRGTDGKLLAGTDPRVIELKPKILDARDFVINPGHYYVQGILIENEFPIAFTEQLGIGPDAPNEVKALPYLIYLDVWERHITYVEDDRIREVALGGPDTASRAQIVWQVKLFKQGQEGDPPPCNATDALPQLGTGKLRARAKQDAAQTDLCVIPPDSRYRGPENQLYRVEIHRGGNADGTPNGATFKWSRENGSVLFPVLEVNIVNGTQVSVRLVNLGRDQRLGLIEGNWVEIADDNSVLQNRWDPLLRVAKIDREQLRVTLEGTTSVTNAGKNKLLRRWDHQGDPAKFGGALQVVEHPRDSADVDWTQLEDGVQIRFDKLPNAAVYNTGDYWLIPARTATGDVEWPHELAPDGSEKLDASSNPIPAAVAVNGPRHYYAPLAGRSAQGLSECRCRLAPLADCPKTT